jgi:hypothetical protein
VIAHVVVLLGLASVAAGVGYQLGVGWGVAVGGAGLIAWALLLFDVDEPEKPERLSELRRRGEG